MTDHDVAELLPFYANGTLDAAARARVESELATCASCAAELRELRTLASTLQSRADAVPPMPERAIDAAFAHIDAASTMSALRTSWWAAPARYAAAAVLVIGVGAAAAELYHAHETTGGTPEAVTFVRAADDAAAIEEDRPRPLTIYQAKAGLALMFGVQPSQIEIVIKG